MHAPVTFTKQTSVKKYVNDATHITLYDIPQINWYNIYTASHSQIQASDPY
jgi:hypothetical protein